jgi:hypothetical protein
MTPVSVRAAVKKYHRLSGIDNRNSLFLVLETEKSEIMVPTGLMSCKDLFSGS